MINDHFVRDSFSESAIIASVRCLKRAKDQNLKVIHQLAFWTIFQKYEKFLHGQLSSCLDKFQNLSLIIEKAIALTIF